MPGTALDSWDLSVTKVPEFEELILWGVEKEAKTKLINK